jgi:AcrR family transcriptional regulator
MMEMPTETLNKHQLRTQETHSRLLDAAEEVFVRDGYEGAQLDEIAKVAGRTKGAVYAHFKSKEDLFLALFEHRTREYIERLFASLQKCASRNQRLDAFRKFYLDLAHDRTWPILTLEFKLYALRHPASKERLRRAFEMTKPPRDNESYKQMFGNLTREQKLDNDLAILALGPILSGLILESHFESEGLSEKAIRILLGRVFDALFYSDAR